MKIKEWLRTNCTTCTNLTVLIQQCAESLNVKESSVERKFRELKKETPIKVERSKEVIKQPDPLTTIRRAIDENTGYLIPERSFIPMVGIGAEKFNELTYNKFLENKVTVKNVVYWGDKCSVLKVKTQIR